MTLTPHTLVTGADGYLGRRVALALAARGARPWLWVRAGSTAEAARKRAALPATLRALPLGFGDLRAAAPFAGIDPGAIGHIVHCGAVTRFNVDAATADAVNRDGTQRLIEFAARCPALERVALLSTLYASGLTAGPLCERPVTERPEFTNAYERSKWAAEHALVVSDLPWQVLRVATVLADDTDGRCGQATAVHNTLRLLKHGLLPVMPGDAATPLYFVTGAYAATAIAELVCAGRARQVYHLSHDHSRSLTLATVIDLAMEAFRADPQFRRRGLPAPPLADQAEFELLVSGVSSLPRGVLKDTLASMAPFAAQLYVHKAVDATHAARDAGAFAPDLAALVTNACHALCEGRPS